MDINKISFGIAGSAQSASTSLTSLIRKLNTLDTAFSTASASGHTFISVLQQISTLSSTINGSMASLPSSARKTGTAFAQSSRQLASATKVMTTHTASTEKVAHAVSNTTDKTASFSKTLKSLGTHTKSGVSNFSKLIMKLTQLTFVFMVLRRTTETFISGIKTAIAYVENLNLFMVALGKNTTRATGFLKEMSESLYLDEAQLTRVQGLFYQISEALGLSSAKAYTLSENFTKLAYDLASFYNITIEDAIVKLQAGLVGETEPLRRIGIIITENNLAETARNLGIKKSIRNMTEMEKIQLRYVTALQQTRNAQGDLARTLEQPENLLRILREQFRVLMRELGNAFIPMIKRVIPEIIGLTMALTKLAKAWAISMGYDAPVIRDDLGGYMKTVAKETEEVEKTTGETAKNLAKILKTTKDTASSMTGIDELNILGDSGILSGIDSIFSTGEVTETTSELDLALEDYNNRMSETEGIFDTIIDKWSTRIDTIREKFSGIFTSTKQAFDQLITTVFPTSTNEEDAVDKAVLALQTVNAITTGILNGITSVYDFFKNLWNDILKPLLEMVAPSWLKSLENGTLAENVERITIALIGLKALMFLGTMFSTLTTKTIPMLGAVLKVVAPLVAIFTLTTKINDIITETDPEAFKIKLKDNLATFFTAVGLGLATGSPTVGFVAYTLLAEFDVIAKLNSSFVDAVTGTPFDTSDWKSLGAQLAQALAVGLGIGSFVNPSAGVLAFSILMTLDIKLGEAWQNLVEKGVKTVVGDASAPKGSEEEKGLIGKAWDWILSGTNKSAGIYGIFDLVGALIDLGNMIAGKGTYSKPNSMGATPKGFAKGGKPQKGSLFIAGEKGAELVGDFGNGTSVINQEQMQSLGIPMYADGVNVPKGSDASSENEQYLKYLKDINKIFNVLPNGIENFGNAVANWATNLIGIDTEGLNTFIDDTKKKFGDFGRALADSDLGQKISEIIGKTFKGLKKVGGFLLDTVSQTYGMYKSSDKLQTIMKPTGDGTTTAQQQSQAGQVMTNLLANIPWASAIFQLMQDIESGLVLEFVNSLPTFIQSGIDMLLGLIDGLKTALPILMKQIPVIITQIVGILTNKDTLNALIEGLIFLVVELVKALPDIIFALVDAIPDIIMTLIEIFIENLPLFFKLGLAIAVSILEGIANLLIGGINAIIEGINWIIPGTGWDIPKIKQADFSALMPKFAEGGYPNAGQMFIAREAGAELVGNIGGRTAVVNNEQIVESVARGVYDAMRQAMSEQPQREPVINIDGRRLSERMDVVKANRGRSFGMGGY